DYRAPAKANGGAYCGIAEGERASRDEPRCAASSRQQSVKLRGPEQTAAFHNQPSRFSAWRLSVWLEMPNTISSPRLKSPACSYSKSVTENRGGSACIFCRRSR